MTNALTANEQSRAVEREAAVPGGEDRPPLTPQQLAAFIESMAENPRGGKPARSAYLHAARLIRERLA